MKRATRKSVAYGTAGAASGVALAVLVLPTLANTVKPTVFFSALLTVSLALLSTVVQRLVDLHGRRTTLAAALKVWPPERLASADVTTLGAYPGRDDDGAPEPYRVRPYDEDELLQLAVEDTHSAIVVVHGPPGAGKSRAAAQAARQSHGHHPVVIPVDGDALMALVDNVVCFPRLVGRRVYVWLDGLDRFIDALTPAVLQLLAGIGDDVRIVATIRSEDWEQALSGGGQRSEVARYLANAARVVKLGPLDPIGEHANRPEPAKEIPVPLDPIWRDRWALVYSGGLLVTLALMIIGGLTGFAGGLLSPPPLENQMSDVLNQMVSEGGVGGGHVVLDKRVQFHPTEAASWVVGVGDTPRHDAFTNAVANCGPASTQNCVSPPPRSDELRIYDVRGGRLSLAFQFRPLGVGKTAAGLDPIPGAGSGGDYDADNAPEVVAEYSWPDGANTVLPFGIYWKDGRYNIVGLTRDRPSFSMRGLDPNMALFIKQAYLKPMLLPNTHRGRFGNLKLAGFKVQAAALVQQPSTRLLTGYDTTYPDSTRPTTLELHVRQVRPDLATVQCTAAYSGCRGPSREEDVVIPPDRDAGAALLDAWRLVGSKWRQPVSVYAAKRRASTKSVGISGSSN
jgi:hypothetical protein